MIVGQNSLIVGVGGQVGHGKDTIGKYLVREFGFVQLALGDRIKEFLEILNPVLNHVGIGEASRELRKMSAEAIDPEVLADLNRECCTPCWPVRDTLQNWLYRFRHTFQEDKRLDWRTAWDVLKIVCPDVRGLMQRLGTDIGRNCINQNFWCLELGKKINQYSPGTRFVITDLPRYKSEADFFFEQCGTDAVFLRVVRPGHGLQASAPEAQHCSEQMAVPDSYFDTTFHNVFTVEELQLKVKSWYNDFMDTRGDAR